MSIHRPRALLAAIPLSIGLVTSSFGTFAAVPMGAPSSTLITGAVTLAIAQTGPSGVSGCQLLPDPRLPIELGTAVSGGLYKTVAMEKDLFRCQAATTGTGQRIRDLETFVEVVQSRDGKLISIGVTLAICDRQFPVGSIDCGFKVLPLGAVTTNPLEGCEVDSAQFPNDPVEMNVVANGRSIKTIKLDKEWYRCPQGLVELYSFTEIMEQLVTREGIPVGFTTTLTRVFGVLCVKDVEKGTVGRCQRWRPV